MIVDALLNLTARVLLRTCAPRTAHAVLMQVGRTLPPLRSTDEVRRAAARLNAAGGTCLSRALAVAARRPSADVVIGVQPQTHANLLAHAWLEIEGVPLRPSDPAGQEITRLRGLRSWDAR